MPDCRENREQSKKTDTKIVCCCHRLAFVVVVSIISFIPLHLFSWNCFLLYSCLFATCISPFGFCLFFIHAVVDRAFGSYVIVSNNKKSVLDRRQISQLAQLSQASDNSHVATCCVACCSYINSSVMVKFFVVAVIVSYCCCCRKQKKKNKFCAFLTLPTMEQSAAYCFTCCIHFPVNHYNYTCIHADCFWLQRQLYLLPFTTPTTAFIHMYAHKYLHMHIYNCNNKITLWLLLQCVRHCFIIVYLFHIV